MWRGRAEQPFPGRQDVWEADAPAKLPPPASGPQQFLPLTVNVLFCHEASAVVSSGLCPVCGSGLGWRGHSQPWLTPTLPTSSESLARMEAVVNLYQEMMKYGGKMLCTCPSSLLPCSP